jgi:transposase InsO family protein
VRFSFIKAEKANHRVTLLCRVLEVSRQGFYAWLNRKPCRRQERDEVLARSIRKAFDDSKGRYGSPRVYQDLRDQGVATSRKRVARIMRQHGQVARPPRRRFVRTTDSRHGYGISPDRVQRDFRPDGPNQVWATDITYISTGSGWLYLAVVLDLFSRRVVGWSMQPHMDRRLVLAALEMAIESRRPSPGLIHHSDRGVQYACDDYRQALTDAEIVASMSRKANCWDNAVVESFFSTLKNELVYRRRFTSHDDARIAMFEYIERFYNRTRRHSTLGYLSPMQYESRAPN